MAELGVNVCLSIGHITASTLSGLGAILKTGCVIVGYVVKELVTKLGVNVCLGVGLVATSTLSGLSTVLGAGCVIVGYVVKELVTELGVLSGESIGNVAASTLSGLSTVEETGCILVVYVVKELVTELGILGGESIGLVTASTLSGLGAVEETGCILVVYVVKELVTELGILSGESIGLVTASTLSGLSTVEEAGRILIVYVVLGEELVTELGVNVDSGNGLVTASTLGGLGTVEETGCITVGYEAAFGMLVTELGDREVFYPAAVLIALLQAVSAVVVRDSAFLGTGGIDLRMEAGEVVAGCGECNVVNLADDVGLKVGCTEELHTELTAGLTYVVSLITVGGTGGSLSGDLITPSVSVCIDIGRGDLACIVELCATAACTEVVRAVTAISTGGSLSGNELALLMLSHSGGRAGSESLAGLVDRYDLDGEFRAGLKIAEYVVSSGGVCNMLAVYVYTVCISTVNCVPGELDL